MSNTFSNKIDSVELSGRTLGLIGYGDIAKAVEKIALAGALHAKKIGGAVVDVVTQEPPRDGNPLLDPELDNLIITPHCAWASVEARARMFAQIAEILKSYKESGTPINRVA